MRIVNRLHCLVFIFSSLGFLAIVSSCSKSNNSNNNNIGGQLTAAIGANSFKASAAAGYYSQSATLFQIVGSNIQSGDTTAFVLSFYPPAKLDVSLNSDTAFVDVQYADSKAGFSYDGGQIAGHSIITVTGWDTTNRAIAGTFSAVVYNTNGNANDSLIISNGQFNVPYAVTP